MSLISFDLNYVRPVPPQLPVTILDLERATECYDMMLPMADPCPNCGAFRMQVGDWVCWGHCFRCFINLSSKEPA